MNLRRYDWLIVLAVFVLFAFGIATITSVELSHGTEEFVFVRKQLLALGLGIGLSVAASSVNYQLFRAYSRVLYVVGLSLLVLVLFFGRELNGTTGWFVFSGFSFQPVEFMKFALILELGRYFSDRAHTRFGWRELFQSGIRAVLPIFLVLQQPDLGGVVILFGIWAMVVFFVGIRWQHIVVLSVGLGLVVGLVLLTGKLEAYQLERLMAFKNPTADPLRAGYNIAQAEIAIGAGGLFGRGLGAGSQSQLRFLPESQTDFIFAVIAEEFGFVGVTIILGAFLLLFTRLLGAAKVTRDTFAAFLLIGIFAAIFLQMFVHIGVNLAIMPATGVTLPFVSYGGSSIIMALLMIGVAEGVCVQLTPVDRLIKPHRDW